MDLEEEMEKGQGFSCAPLLDDEDESYKCWKSVLPTLYDWITHHHLFWPSLSCRWGPQIKHGTVENCQHLYLTEQTDGNCPTTLFIADCEVFKEKVPTTKHISEFNEETQSPFVKECKTLIHPGEVNRIRELPQNINILATHTDSPDVFIWDVCAQPNRVSSPGVAQSHPDAILTGHTKNAQFALAMCHTEPFVLSGGQDKSVVLWSIEDCITSLGLKESGIKDCPKIFPRGVFEGHDATVEDVQFCPSSAQEFCSVGDDSCLILWDARAGNAPAVKVQKVHDNDVHCVDWNTTDSNLILTGSADHTVRMFDRRILTANGVASPIHKFEGHNAPVVSIQWSPHTASVFASAADDGFLKIWDYDVVGKKNQNAKPILKPSASGLIFAHPGHRAPIMDFHWNPAEPWTIASVSSNVEMGRVGGTLQIWRISSMFYKPAEDFIAERLEACSSPAESKKSKCNVSSSAAESKKSKSKASTRPAKSKKSKPYVSSPVVDSKKSKSKCSTSPAESKKSKRK